MSSNSDWYRSSDWDGDAQQVFNEKMTRKRDPGRACSFYCSKASAIRSQHPEDALELLYRALNQCRWPPEELAVQEDHQSGLHLWIGETHHRRGHLHAAEFHYRMAVNVRPAEVRKTHHSVDPEERLAGLLIGDENKDRREEAEAIWEAYYRFHFSAVDVDFPSYALMENREYVDYFDQPYTDLGDAAESVISAYHTQPNMSDLMKNNRESLAALDAHFRKDLGRFQPRREYLFDFLTKHAVLEFGAFFGRVLVKELGGQWQLAQPIMKSRVRIGRKKIDPFLVGWRVVFYECRLTDAFDEVAASQATPAKDRKH